MMVGSDPVLTRKTVRFNEEQLLRQIEFYDQKASDYSQEHTPLGQALATVYRYSAQKKRELLATFLENGSVASSEFPY